METKIGEITQSPLMRNELSKSTKRQTRRKQQKAKVTENEDEQPFENALSYEAPDSTKHVRPYESRLDIAWRLRHGSGVRRPRECSAELIVSLCQKELGQPPSILGPENLENFGCSVAEKNNVLRYLKERFTWDGGGHNSFADRPLIY